MDLVGRRWAQPVVHKRWAFVATILDSLSRCVGQPMWLHGPARRAWEKAVGVERV